jgi:Zn-finger domain-containing protein
MTIIQPTPAEKNFLNRAEECKSLSQEINRRLAKLKRRDEIPYIVGLYDRNNLEKLQEVKETLDQRDREAAAAEKSAIPKPLTPAEEIDRLSRLHKENREK